MGLRQGWGGETLPTQGPNPGPAGPCGEAECPRPGQGVSLLMGVKPGWGHQVLGQMCHPQATGRSQLDLGQQAQAPGERPDPPVTASLGQAAPSPHEEAPRPAICYLVFKFQFCHPLAV